MTTDPEEEKDKRIWILRRTKTEFDRTPPACQKWSQPVWLDRKLARILLIYPELAFRGMLNNCASQSRSILRIPDHLGQCVSRQRRSTSRMILHTRHSDRSSFPQSPIGSECYPHKKWCSTVVNSIFCLDLDSSKFPTAISGVAINGSIGARFGQTIDSRPVFQCHSSKRELNRTRVWETGGELVRQYGEYVMGDDRQDAAPPIELLLLCGGPWVVTSSDRGQSERKGPWFLLKSSNCFQGKMCRYFNFRWVFPWLTGDN
jgi:hypothetical protein